MKSRGWWASRLILSSVQNVHRKRGFHSSQACSIGVQAARLQVGNLQTILSAYYHRGKQATQSPQKGYPLFLRSPASIRSCQGWGRGGHSSEEGHRAQGEHRGMRERIMTSTHSFSMESAGGMGRIVTTGMPSRRAERYTTRSDPDKEIPFSVQCPVYLILGKKRGGEIHHFLIHNVYRSFYEQHR